MPVDVRLNGDAIDTRPNVFRVLRVSDTQGVTFGLAIKPNNLECFSSGCVVVGKRDTGVSYPVLGWVLMQSACCPLTVVSYIKYALATFFWHA